MESVTDGLTSINSYLTDFDAKFFTSRTTGFYKLFTYMGRIDDNLYYIAEALMGGNEFEDVFTSPYVPLASMLYDELEQINESINSIYEFFTSVDENITLPNDVTDIEINNPFKLLLYEVIYKVSYEIEQLVNPTTEENIDEYETALNNVKDNTFFGVVEDAKTGLTSFVEITNANPQAGVQVWTLGRSSGLIRVNPSLINIDLSWYEPYREQAQSIIGNFMWVAFLWLVIKQIPNIINGGAVVTEIIGKDDD